MVDNKRLAIFGGKAVRQKPFPERFLFNHKEKKIVNKLLDHSIRTGKQIRYSGEYQKKYQNKLINLWALLATVIALTQALMLYCVV